MFTGIIEEVGKIQSILKRKDSVVVVVQAGTILKDIHPGDSIAVNGVCLTVTFFSQSSFTADVMHETLNRSSLGSLHVESPVNLERAIPANSRFGGHIVSGHIDGTGTVSTITKDDNAIWYTIKTSFHVLRYIIEKGSIAVDGISLTVAKVHKDGFSVSIIPHSASHTILSEKRIGDTVNLENDCIGKYVEKLISVPQANSNITAEFLAKYGF